MTLTATEQTTVAPYGAADPPAHGRGLRRALLGPAGQPAWVRPSALALLIVTGLLYCWNLAASGWGNDFYAAAVQSGTQSWKALLFGSLDPGNAITVDKPPASLWVMGLSGRIFGFNSWSMLLPQALMGIASVALLYAAVKRWNGPVAGLLAGAVLAFTPVAALMFRFNNPDALLVLLLVAAAYCVVRATDAGSGWWLAAAGSACGFAFLTKMLQGFLVVPAFALVFLVAAPGSVRSRLVKLLGAFVTMIVSAGWFVALVALWPADSRPYIGGSTDNSLLQLALGYNGLGRILGGAGNGGGGGGGHGSGGGGQGGPPGGNTMFGGSTGITRLFGDSFGVEISWLLPAALIGLLAGLWFTRRTPRTGKTRAALILWGGWTLLTGIVFSYMQGTIHPYYMVALAPGIAGVIGVSVYELWRGRAHLGPRIALGLMAAATGVWTYILLDRTPDWMPALRWIVLVGCLLVATALIVGVHQFGRGAVVVAICGLCFGLLGPVAYSIETASQPHTGSIPTAGPNTGGMGGGPGGMGGPGGSSTGSPGGNTKGGPAGNGMGGNRSGGPGGGSAANPQLDALLRGTHTRWAAATLGSQSAGSLELRTGASVMAIGGFTGSDPSPTLAQFQKYVADGDVRYFIASDDHMGGGPGGGGDGTGQQISEWVKAHFTSKTYGTTTVYDLNSPTTGS